MVHADRRPLLLAVLLGLLSACTLQPTDTQSSITSATEWELRGKLGYRSPAQSGSALINWQQQGDNYRIHLSGPFGAGAVDINGSVPTGDGKGKVTFREAGKPARSSDDVAALLQEILGWHLPVESALHWVRGQSGNSNAIVERADNGELSTINEAGWTVNYLAYGEQTDAADKRLPRKLRLSRDDLRLTLIIKKWRAPRAAKTPAG